MLISLQCKKQWKKDMVSEFNSSGDIFECRMCGECCRGFGGTYVSRTDIDNICTLIKADPDMFIKKYCDPSGSRFVLTTGEDGCCIFFDKEKQCTIHPVKPYMCKAWPFIEPVIKYPENWNAMAGSCPGIRKDIPHKDLIKIVSKERKKLDNS